MGLLSYLDAAGRGGGGGYIRHLDNVPLDINTIPRKSNGRLILEDGNMREIKGGGGGS